MPEDSPKVSELVPDSPGHGGNSNIIESDVAEQWQRSLVVPAEHRVMDSAQMSVLCATAAADISILLSRLRHLDSTV